jgi:hypothetical protein
MIQAFKLAGLSCVYRTTNQGNDKSLQVVLPNGRKVELSSKEGADEFVETVGTEFISTSLTATSLTAMDNQEPTQLYALMCFVICNASPDKIASGIPESELHIFIAQIRDSLGALSTDYNWLRSGAVPMYHEPLIRIMAGLSSQPSFLKAFLSNGGMEAVAQLYASRGQNGRPSHPVVAALIRILITNTVASFEQKGLSYEKGFNTIEKTGLLGQFIRCVRVDPESSAQIVASVQSCLQLVKKKFKSGTPTGDILDAVIAGKDGPISEKAKTDLTRLQTLARLSNTEDSYDKKCMVIKRCFHCRKLETQMASGLLMKCQRCKTAYYCSKRCQVANWKIHKIVCNDHISSGVLSRSTLKTSEATLWAFIESNYFAIAKEVYKKTQEFNVNKRELLLEIDFGGDAPALRNEFKVCLTSSLLGGSSIVDAPDWFRIDADKKKFAQLLRVSYDNATASNMLHVACRAANVVQFVCIPEADVGGEFLSDEAVESIGREDYVRMVACLGQKKADTYFEEKMSGLA